MNCSLITYILILSLSMSGVFASVSIPIISSYATDESPTGDSEQGPNTTDESAPQTDGQPDNTLTVPQDGQEPCPEGQVTNPQTGECTPPSTNFNNITIPNNTILYGKWTN
jgi:hypothetical protein